MQDDFSRKGYITLFGIVLNDCNWNKENLIDFSRLEGLFNFFYLSDKTMEVLKLRYGMINRDRVRTLKEVSKIMNISIADVRYHEQKAFKEIMKCIRHRHMLVRREDINSILKKLISISDEVKEILELERSYLDSKDESIKTRLILYYNDRLTAEIYEKDILMRREEKHRELLSVYGNSVDCKEEIFVKPFREDNYVLPFEINKWRARASIRELNISFDFLVELHYSGVDTIDDLEANLYNNIDFFSKFKKVSAKDRAEIEYYMSARKRTYDKGNMLIDGILDSDFKLFNVHTIIEFLLCYDYLTHTWNFSYDYDISKIINYLESNGFLRGGKPFI